MRASIIYGKAMPIVSAIRRVAPSPAIVGLAGLILLRRQAEMRSYPLRRAKSPRVVDRSGIDVERDAFRSRGIARQPQIDQHPAERMTVLRSGSRPQASLKAGSARSRSQAMAKMRAVGHGVPHPLWIAPIVDHRGQPVSQAQATLSCGHKYDAAIRGDAAAVKRRAVILLRPTAGKDSGSNVFSVMARQMRWKGWPKQPNLSQINRLSYIRQPQRPIVVHKMGFCNGPR